MQDQSQSCNHADIIPMHMNHYSKYSLQAHSWDTENVCLRRGFSVCNALIALQAHLPGALRQMFLQRGNLKILLLEVVNFVCHVAEKKSP